MYKYPSRNLKFLWKVFRSSLLEDIGLGDQRHRASRSYEMVY